MKGAVIHSEDISPLSNRMSFPVKGNAPASAGILGLFFHGAPFAVTRIVVSITIDSLNGVLRCGFLSHIGDKVFKRVKPPITNLNPSASVPVPRFDIRVAASLFNAAPRSVFWCSGQLVRGLKFVRIFNTDAATRSGMPIVQVSTQSEGFGSTITFTNPTGLVTFGVLSSGDNCESTELLAREVFEISWHINLRKIIRKLSAWQAGTVPAFHPLRLATGGIIL